MMRFETEERGKRRIYRVRKDLTSAGRDLACDISLASVSVSRRHVEFTRDGTQLRFKDLGSRNGVRLNGQTVREGTLRDGDRLQIGDVPLVFYAGEGQGPPPAEESEARSPTGEEQAPTPLDLSLSSAAPAPAAEAPPSPASPRVPPVLKSRKVLIAAGAAILLVAAALAARPFLKPKPVPTPSYTPADYEDEIRRSLEAFSRYEAARLRGSSAGGEALSEARQILGHARSRMPDRELAGKLERAMSFQERLGKDYASFPHDDAWKAWAEVKKVRGLSPDVEVLATQRQKWMDAENESLRVLLQAKGRAAEGKLDEALSMLAGVPAGSLSRSGADELAASLKGEGFQDGKAKAEAAESRGDWARALELLDAAGAYADTEERKASLAGIRRRVEAKRDEEALYAEGRKAFLEGDAGKAKELLARLPSASPFAESAREMLDRIRRDESLAGLRTLFARGEGRKVLTEIASLSADAADPAAVAELKSLVEHVVKASDRAEGEERADRLPEAERAWKEVASALSEGAHKGNAYRLRAEGFLAKWTPEAIAGHYLDLADKRAKAEDYKGARDLYELARKCDPKGEMGVEAVKKVILPMARHLQTEAFGLKAAGKTDLARKTLEEAIAMLRPGDANYESIRKDLAALGQ